MSQLQEYQKHVMRGPDGIIAFETFWVPEGDDDEPEGWRWRFAVDPKTATDVLPDKGPFICRDLAVEAAIREIYQLDEVDAETAAENMVTE